MSPPPTAEALPTALVDREQWVCWRTHERDGKPTKVPIIPGTTQFASTTDPDSWTSFLQARQAAASTPVAGLGFVFTADDPLVGIDLDDCRDPDADTPTAWAAELLDTLDSYSEVSPSGTGYHVIVRGERPEGRNRAGNFEVYDRSRFFTVTGAHVSATPETVTARSDALATVVAEELSPNDTAPASDNPDSDAAAKSTATESASTDAAVPVSDDELLERAQHAANGDKFARLWHGSTRGYESHSEADLALCRMLAFWTGGDASRVDRLFRRSDLYRDKWDAVHYADGSTYGEKTVERAVRATDETYTPPEATESPAETNATAGTSGGASQPDTTDPASAPTETPDPPVDAVDATPPADDLTELPSTHPDRAQARHDRIVELSDRIEELVEENERLRAELETERQRRRELEPTDDESASGWWPFGNE
jgi:primase-polymerase (primpol)-like protein